MKFEKYYSKEFTVTNNLLDCYDSLTMSSILDFSQEIAGRHADLIHVGFDDFISRNLIWIVIRNKFEILKDVKEIKELTLDTAIIQPRMFEFPRDYSFKINGEEIIRGRSVWMIYDLKENKPVIPKDIEVLQSDEIGMYQRLRKSERKDIQDLHFEKKYTVRFSDLDHNGHMNNTHYTDFYYDLFCPKRDEQILSFQIEYILQCYLGDVIDLYSAIDNNKKYIYGFKEDKLAFYLEVITNNSNNL